MDILSLFGDIAAPTSRIALSNSAWDGLSAMSAMSSMFSNLFSLASTILVIIGTWKVLEKAGEQGWKAIIPFYNSYTLYKKFWEKKWFWISLIPTAITTIGTFVLIVLIITAAVLSGSAKGFDTSAGFSALAGGIIGFAGAVFLMVAGAIFSFVLNVILNVKIAKAFGKSGGFAVGLILLAPVFYMILGCSKDIKYIKPKETR